MTTEEIGGIVDAHAAHPELPVPGLFVTRSDRPTSPRVAMSGAVLAVAQGRDGLLNGAMIGAAVGAGIGVAVTHGVRDSDLVFGQYARGALVFAAMGAGVGVGIDALFNRVSSGPTVTPRRVLIAAAVWRNFAGVAARWRW